MRERAGEPGARVEVRQQDEGGADDAVSSGHRVIVADSAPTRLAVRMALDGLAVVCAEAASCEAAVRAAIRERPDVCLVGQLLPGDGIETVRRLSEAVPESAVVLLACSDDVNVLLAALRAGALGYVPPGVGTAQLRRIVRAVLAQEASVPRAMVRELVNELRAPARAADERLTERQAQILGMLRRGNSTAGIAARLGISPVTVRRHISELVHKTGVSDRGELVSTASDFR
jgi:two-component system, NarL family, nitrate/nitrite response regulator NarL